MMLYDNKHNSLIESSFENDATNTNSMRNQLNEFISSSFAKDKLKGKQWDAVRAKMQEFDNALSIREKCITNLSETITNAINKINNCIDSYNGEIPIPDKIDFAQETSKANTMMNKYNEMKRVLESEYQTALYYESLNVNNKKNMIGSSRSTGEIKADIDYVYNEYQKYQKYRNFLVRLLSVYNTEKAKLEIASTELDSLSQTVNKISVSSAIKN